MGSAQMHHRLAEYRLSSARSVLHAQCQPVLMTMPAQPLRQLWLDGHTHIEVELDNLRLSFLFRHRVTALRDCGPRQGAAAAVGLPQCRCSCDPHGVVSRASCDNDFSSKGLFETWFHEYGC